MNEDTSMLPDGTYMYNANDYFGEFTFNVFKEEENKKFIIDSLKNIINSYSEDKDHHKVFRSLIKLINNMRSSNKPFTAILISHLMSRVFGSSSICFLHNLTSKRIHHNEYKSDEYSLKAY